MSKSSILNKSDLASIEKIYGMLYEQTKDSGMPEENRVNHIRNIMDSVLQNSIKKTIESGIELSKSEIQNMRTEFYKCLSSVEAQFCS